jgi:RNA polymerase sigma-70 factor (ECF subfamily)
MAVKPIKSKRTATSNIGNAFLANNGGLKSYLKRWLSSSHDIEDVLQDTYIRALEAEKKSEISSPKAFLYRVTRNIAINYKVRKARELTGLLEELDFPEALETEPLVVSVEQEQRFSYFCRAVKHLPPQCRRVFVLRKVYGLSHQEIADQLHLSTSTVEKHLARGLNACREYMEKKGFGDGTT